MFLVVFFFFSKIDFKLRNIFRSHCILNHIYSSVTDYMKLTEERKLLHKKLQHCFSPGLVVECWTPEQVVGIQTPKQWWFGPSMTGFVNLDVKL